MNLKCYHFVSGVNQGNIPFGLSISHEKKCCFYVGVLLFIFSNILTYGRIPPPLEFLSRQ